MPRVLSTREVAWISVALLLGLLPHMQRFPVLLSIAFVGALLWRLLGAMGQLPLPDREHVMLWVGKQFIAVAAFVSVYVAYRGQLGREAGVELLAALLGLKLLEMRSPRDYYVVTFLCYFLVVTNFFYSQTMLTAVYMLGLVVFVTTLLVQFNTPVAYRTNLGMSRLAGLMTAQAVPLMLIAFVLFPRIPGPLWGLPQDAFSAVSGLSEEMQVGQFARLGLSDEIAFRIEFHGDEPRARDLYWRGPVLWKTDGFTWTAGKLGNGPPGLVEPRGPEYHYTVTLEPNTLRLLMGLEMVTAVETNARRTSDHRILSGKPIRRRIQYDLRSVVDYRLPELSREERRAALQLPVVPHQRTKALALSWADEATSRDEIIARALAFYRNEGFGYTLTPPVLTDDPIDQFLFDTRQGFCEHFAGSFVVLMRAAGIPARVVTGYQGGEYSSVADYMIVRQRDAHAWAEVYDEQRGWMRVDPTAAVAPERVSLGFETVMPRRSGISAIEQSEVASALLTRLRDSIDAVTYGWNQWVLGYTPQQQKRLLDDLGLDDWDYGTLVIVLTIVLAVAVLALAWLMVRIERQPRDPASAAWAEFSRKLARLGLARAPSEAPQAYARRVIAARADLAREVTQITRLYTQLRYGRVAVDPRLLARRVRSFAPPRAP